MRMLKVLLEKEFTQFFRNPFIPKVVVMYPIMLICVIPFVTNMDVKHLNVSVVDHDNSTLSRRITGDLASSEYFSMKDAGVSFETAMEALEKGRVDAIVDIPEDFEKSLLSSSPKTISISANGVNATKGSLGSSYTSQSVIGTISRVMAEKGAAGAQSGLVSVRYMYNSTLQYRNYMIPALIIITLLLLCGFLPALNIVGEKEKGTIEQINVTPTGKFTFTMAKLLPYWIMGLLVLLLCMLLAGIVYGLWPAGSFWAIILGAFLFILCMSGLGVFLSNKAGTMLQVMLLMFFFAMIFILMSGLMTPVDSMPKALRWMPWFFPPTYVVEIMRDVYLKGTTVGELWHCYAALAVLAVFFDLTAVITYKKQE